MDLGDTVDRRNHGPVEILCMKSLPEKIRDSRRILNHQMTFVFNSLWFREEGQSLLSFSPCFRLFKNWGMNKVWPYSNPTETSGTARSLLDRGNGETGTLRTWREMSLLQVGEPKNSFNKTLYSNLHPLFIYKDPGSPKSWKKHSCQFAAVLYFLKQELNVKPVLHAS